MHKKLVITITALALLIAACGGGGDKKDADSSGNSSKSSEGSDAGDSGGDSGATDEIDALLKEYQKAKIKITYKKPDGSEMTIAQDGKGKVAYIEGDSATYVSDGKTVTCSGRGTDQTCTEVDSSLGSLYTTGVFGMWGAVFQGVKSLPGVKVSSERIAGRDAKCITWDPSAITRALGGDSSSGEKGTMCVDEKSGFVLKIDDSSSSSSNLEAVSVGDPSDRDFEPPVTPETVPDLSDIGGID